MGSLGDLSDRRPTRSTSVPPLGGSAVLRRKLQVSREDQVRMQSLLLTADVNSQEIQVQKMENQLLKNKIETLIDNRKDVGSSNSGPHRASSSRSKQRSR